MPILVLKEELVKDIARKYSRKGEKYELKGPIYCNSRPYWLIRYMKVPVFGKKTTTGFVILDEEMNVVEDEETFKRVVSAYLYPKPTSEFFRVYSEELREMKVLQRYFCGERKFIGKVDVVDAIANMRGLPRIEPLGAVLILLEEIVRQAGRIGEIVTRIMEVKMEALRAANNLMRVVEWRDVDEFDKNVTHTEYNLILSLIGAFEERQRLLSELVRRLENIREREGLPGFVYDLLQNARTEAEAIRRLNIYFEQILAWRNRLKAASERSRELANRYFETLRRRIS